MMVNFVTTNEGKYQEVKRIAEEYGVDVSWLNYRYDEFQGENLEEVALKSAKHLAKKVEPMFVIEDSGLFVEALKGFPGVYSSYVFKTIGNEGILKLMEGVENRRAKFVAVVVFYDGSEFHVFRGEVEGRIAEEIRGTHGFGFDPIFEYQGRTFAEMGEEKNKVSHRRRAFQSFFEWLTKNF